MEIIKTIRGAALGLVAATLTITASESKIIYPSLDYNQVREQVILATDRVESRIQDAQKLINEARSNALQGIITSADAIKIIKEQNALITKLENQLKIKLDEAMETVKAADQGGYLTSFRSGAQDLGSRALAPFRSGYGYTKQQKIVATKVIEGLVEQQEQLTKDYDQALTDKLSYIERATLKKRYETIIAGLNQEIYQQQLITGAVISSTQRKLFWAAVVAGAAVASVYFLAPGAAITPEVVKEIEGALAEKPYDMAKSQPTIARSTDASTEPSGVTRNIEFQKPTLDEVMASVQEQEVSPVQEQEISPVQEQEVNLLEKLQDDISIEGDAVVTGYPSLVGTENQPTDQSPAEQKISDSDALGLATESSVHTLTAANESAETLPGEFRETAMQSLDAATTNDAGAHQDVWSENSLDDEKNIEPANELPVVLEPEISTQEALKLSEEAALPTQEPELISQDSAGLLQELDNGETQLTSHNPIKRR